MIDEPPFDLDYDQSPTSPAPPNDHLAEQYVLGAVLVDHTQYAPCARHLAPSDFYHPRHETIWRAITTVHAAGIPPEPAAVLAELIDTKQLNSIGGASYLHDLAAMASNPLAAEHYADRIDKLARRRAAITELTRGLALLRSPGADTDVDKALHDATATLTEATEALANLPQTTTWSPVDLGPVLAGEHLDPPPTMCQRSDGISLFYEGAVHTVAGESESGKTWLTLFAAMQVQQTGRNVLFLDFEDRADRVIGRLLALGATPTDIRNHFAYVRPDRPLDDDGRHQLEPHLENVDLVILDGVTEAMTTHGFDLNSNADSALFQALLPRWLADHGPAVVMIDHVVKDKEKQDRFALGAQHKLAGIDGAAYIVKMIQPFGRGKRGLASVEVAKDRPGHVREHTHGRKIADFSLDATGSDVILIAHLNAPKTTSTDTGDAFEPTYLMEKISRYVQLNPGLSKNAIEAHVNGKKETRRLALELLVTRGYIGTKAGPRGAIQHHHIKAYYQPTDDDQDTDKEAS